ncbi:hypothetical protein [Listeria valentina]|uniref:hypothetical protein n=1 Tax=Listeria valentina TaxID=2705293 RepID=UPI00142F835E|nr:hypothetical protein [Listeria valentina]
MQEAVILATLIVIGFVFFVFEYHFSAKRVARYMKENNLTKKALRDKVEIYED